MMRSEEHHNTPAQVREYLAEALAITAELEPPEALRAAVFTKAADLLSGKQLFFDQAAPLNLGGMAIPRARH